jgi:hypothetical protein
VNFNIFVAALSKYQRREGSGRGDGSVAGEVMNVDAQQRARSVGYGDLCIPDRESVTSTQIARGHQESAIEPNGLSFGRLDDPDALAPLYGEGDTGLDSRNDNIGVRAADGSRFAKNALTQGLANANLRISGGSHRGRVFRS